MSNSVVLLLIDSNYSVMFHNLRTIGHLLISAPSPGVYYFFVVGSVCVSVTNIASSFFVCRWNLNTEH